MDWSGVDYCDVFISCLDSDGTHSLQSIHWWDTDAMLHFSKGWEHFQKIFFLGEAFLLFLKVDALYYYAWRVSWLRSTAAYLFCASCETADCGTWEGKKGERAGTSRTGLLLLFSVLLLFGEEGLRDRGPEKSRPANRDSSRSPLCHLSSSRSKRHTCIHGLSCEDPISAAGVQLGAAYLPK